MTETTDAVHSMTCMEIWGGNRATEREVNLPGLDAWVYSQPYQQADVGGDVYYVSNCATGRITRLLLADVSGHGASVAATANSLRMLMRRYVNHIQQAKFVTSMNGEFANLSREDGFATAVVATFLAPTRRLTFSNAGHPSPYIYTAKDQRWQHLELRRDGAGHLHTTTDLPLGIFEEGTYAELELFMEVGDMILFHTDAFIESRDPNGNILGSEAFLEIISQLDASRPESLVGQIVAKVSSLVEGNLTDDDVTLLLFRATGEGRQIPFENRMMAPIRLLKGMFDSVMSGGRGMPLPEFSLANLGGPLLDSLNQYAKRKKTS